MIKVSVMYPSVDGARFDMAYYKDKHMAMVRDAVGDACRRIVVEAGLNKEQCGVPSPYVAVGHLYFDSLSDFQQAFGPHRKAFAADVANYTDLAAVMQISEVLE